MIDKNRALAAKEWISKLANGINPLNGTAIKDGDIVNDVHISRCLFYVSELIDSAINSDTKVKKSKNFSISAENIAEVYISGKTGIAAFVREINKVLPEDSKTVSTNKVLDWLSDNGFVTEVINEEGRRTRRPTETGNSIGITTETRIGTTGPYTSVVYDENAQRLILQNIMLIMSE